MDSLDLDLVDYAFTFDQLLLGRGSCEFVAVGAINEGPNVVISRSTSVEQGEFGDKTTVQTHELTARGKRHT